MGWSLPKFGLSLFVLLAFSGQAYAFGAGNIASLSKIEGQNWRHGDIEDALLSLFLARAAGGRKFGKLDVKRVYFGNWLRDYSQAVDVGTVKYVSAEAIRILIWVLGFMSFGYGTREFEVTTERLGCYQPTEHIDNPQGYAEGEDARNYDRRLRGPVDEERELSIDPRTGLKSYIASEDMGIETSANLIRQTLGRSIQLGRRYARSRNDEDLHEALRLLGTGLHCLEDYAAHSNYTELSLVELGERDVFPHVGRDTMVEVDGASDQVYPIVTGTFGGVDFFHSVLGELSDKTMQSEIQSLEGVIAESENDSPSESFLQNLLSKIPSGLIGDTDAEAGKMDDFKAKADDAKHKGDNISPREPEEWIEYLNNVQTQIYPVLEWHDELLKTINQAIEKIPVLPELIEQIQDQITLFVFSVLAPYVLPIIKQVKSELETGSSEVIQSSREQQHIVFNDDSCSNPTHSMLSKDHFSNVLNEPAGRIASSVVKWTVPQLMQCWDDEDADIDRTLTRIISGVFHHPALREYGHDGAVEMRQIMFSTVEKWWSEKDDDERDALREQLSRDGVLEGRNHKEGVLDCGHGCGKPLALPKGPHIAGGSTESNDTGIERLASKALGGGALGGLVGGLVGGMGSMLLNKSDSNEKDDRTDGGEYAQRPQRHEDQERYEPAPYGDAPPRHEYQERYEPAPYGGAPPRQEYQQRYEPAPYGDAPPHQEYQQRYEPAPYGDAPPPRPSAYEHGSQPAAQYGYSQDPYARSDYPPNPPPMPSYHHEEVRQYQDSGGYYQERRDVYEGGQQYERTERYVSSEQPSYNRGGYEQEYSSGYGGGGSSGYERPSYPPQEEGYGRRYDDGAEERVEHHHHHRERRHSGSSKSGSDGHRRHHHHRHHRSGSEDSD